MKLGLFYDYHEGLAFEAELGVTVGPPRWGRLGVAGEPVPEDSSFRNRTCTG